MHAVQQLFSFISIGSLALTLYLPVSSAEKFSNSSDPWSSRSKLFDTLMIFLKEFFKKIDFEKNRQTTKSKIDITVGKELIQNRLWTCISRQLV